MLSASMGLPIMLPTIDDLLANLYRMKAECRAQIAAAEAQGDLKEARAFQKQIARINTMIQKKGGDLNA